MVAPGFIEVADPVWVGYNVCPAWGKQDAGKFKTRVRQAGLTTETLRHGVLICFLWVSESPWFNP